MIRLLLLACLAIAAMPTAANAEVLVGGVIDTAATWTAANSPYRVTSEVRVVGGATLRIEAGVTVRFDPGTALVVELGALEAVGGDASPIVLTSNRDRVGANPPAAPGDWQGVRFLDGTSDTLTRVDHAEIRYGAGIEIVSASPRIDRTRLWRNQGAAIRMDLASSPRGAGLTATENTLNGVLVPSGTILGSVRWALLGIPIIVEEGQVAIGAEPVRLSPSPLQLNAGSSGSIRLQLAKPAPPGGLDFPIIVTPVTVATAPPSALVAAGSSHIDIPVNAVADGAATISVNNELRGSASADIQVGAALALAIAPSPLTVPVNAAASITVTSSVPAPAAGLPITLTTSPTGRAQVAPSATIPAGSSSISLPVNGVALGSAVLRATASNYRAAEATVEVTGGTLAWPTSGLFVAPNQTRALRITLSQPAPTTGVSLSLSVPANQSHLVQFPATLDIPAGASFADVSVQGRGPGGTVRLRAQGPGYAAAEVDIAIQDYIVAFVGATNGQRRIAAGLTEPFNLQLSSPAPTGGITFQIASSDEARARVSASTVTFPSGQTQAAGLNLIGVADGTATIAVSTTGLATRSLAVTVLPAARLEFDTLEMMGFQTPSPVLANGFDSRVTIRRRSGSQDYIPPAGVTITLSSAETERVGVPATVEIPAGQSSVTVLWSGLATTQGSVRIEAASAGYQPAVANATVVAPVMELRGLDDFRDLGGPRDQFSIGWRAPAGAPIGYLTRSATTVDVAIVNASPPNVVDGIFVAPSGGAAVSQISVPAGQSQGTAFVGQIQVDSGSYRVRASAPGLAAQTSLTQQGGFTGLRFSQPTLTLGRTLESSQILTRMRQGRFDVVGFATATLVSADPGLVAVQPSTVEFSPGSSNVPVRLAGQGNTALPVTVTASSPSFPGLTATSAATVVEPVLEFTGLPASATLGSGRIGFTPQFRVPGSSGINVTPTARQIALEVVNATPPDIVAGIFDSNSGGQLISTVTIPAGSNGSSSVFVGSPTVAGSFALRATIPGLGQWTSPMVAVSAGQMVVQPSGPIRLGLGLRRSVSIVRQSGGSTLPIGPGPFTVESSDPERLGTSHWSDGQRIQIELSALVGPIGDVAVTVRDSEGQTLITFPVSLVPAEFKFLDLDGTRDPAGPEDEFMVALGAIDDESEQCPVQDVDLSLGISDANPPNIVPGLRLQLIRDLFVSSVYCNTSDSGRLFVRSPVATGTYRVRATGSNGVTTDSDTQEVVYTGPQPDAIGFAQPTLGHVNGFSRSVNLRRLRQGSPLSVPLIQQIALSATGPISVPASVNITAGSPGTSVPVTATGVGPATLTATAIAEGQTLTASLPITVGGRGDLEVRFGNIENPRYVGASRNGVNFVWRMRDPITGEFVDVDDARSQGVEVFSFSIIDQTSPGVIDGIFEEDSGGEPINSLTLPSGDYATWNYVYVGEAHEPGTYRLRVSAGGLEPWTSEPITVEEEAP
jgi:hypothetical protein